MSTWRDSLDGQPGVAPETRILTDATVLVIFPVTLGINPANRARLVLRFDQRGNISAALQSDTGHSAGEPI
jgi:hypothetical protein